MSGRKDVKRVGRVIELHPIFCAAPNRVTVELPLQLRPRTQNIKAEAIVVRSRRRTSVVLLVETK